MNTYLIEPLAPLVFRSGKPFGSQSAADGANFPLPSSMAGMLRTVTAEQNKQAFDDSLKQQAVYGPLLVRYQDEKSLEILVPKPADAMYLKNTQEHTELVKLSPKPFDVDCFSDLPNNLLPVQMEKSLKGKPVSGAQFWRLKDLIEWQDKTLPFGTIEEHGLKNLASEQRTHVALDDTSLASDDGRLFQTSGLDLKPTINETANNRHFSNSRLGFLAQTTANIKQDLVTLGGEKRLSRLIRLEQPTSSKPDKELAKKVNSQKGLKITLVTPAIFKQGYLPDWIDPKTLSGVCPLLPTLKLTLRAVAIDRWLPVSGWDLAQWKPKAMRKAVAAGAVYWFAIEGTAPDNLGDLLWLKPLSDDEQEQRDGFGLMLPAAWQAI